MKYIIAVACEVLPSGLAEIDVEELATAFRRQMQRVLDPMILRTIDERNRAESAPDVCHSHDFCDANMEMFAALCELLGPQAVAAKARDELEIVYFDKDIAVVALWNHAWNLAKEAGFSVPV